MIKIPQTLKSLTLCTTLAIAASVNGTHPAQAAGVPLEGNNTGTVTYGGTFSDYSVPQKWTFSEGTSNITTPTIIAKKGQSTYTFPAQDPKILVTGTLAPNLYRPIDTVQRDIVPSYTIEALNSRGERVTAIINENGRQIVTLPISQANSLTPDYIGHITLEVAESRIIAIDLLRQDTDNNIKNLIPTTIIIIDDMAATAGPSAIGCAFPSTEGGPAGFHPSGEHSYIGSGKYYPSIIEEVYRKLTYKGNAGDTIRNFALNSASDNITTLLYNTIIQGSPYTHLTNGSLQYVNFVDDMSGVGGSISNTSKVYGTMIRSSCSAPSQVTQYLDQFPVENLLPNDLHNVYGFVNVTGTDMLNNLATGQVPFFPSSLIEVHTTGAMSVAARPVSVTYKKGQEPADWNATLTLVFAPL